MPSSTPSLRRMWRMYKALLAEDPEIDRRDIVLAQTAFYTGARGILKVLDFLIERGEYDEVHRFIAQHGRQIDRLIWKRPRLAH